jgi:hypothetical protein
MPLRILNFLEQNGNIAFVFCCCFFFCKQEMEITKWLLRGTYFKFHIVLSVYVTFLIFFNYDFYSNLQLFVIIVIWRLYIISLKWPGKGGIQGMACRAMYTG